MLKQILSNKLLLGCLIAGVLITTGILLWTQKPRPDTTREHTADVMPKKREKETAAQTSEQPSPEATQSKDDTKPTMVYDVATGTATSQYQKQNAGTDAPPQKGDGRSNTDDTDYSHFSLKELIAFINELEPEELRALIAEPWFKPLVEEEAWHLSTEEQVTLEAALLRAFPESKKEYEEKSGLPRPPPGYTHSQREDGSWELIKYNTPHLRIRHEGPQGYERWWILSDAEWERYKLLNAITLAHMRGDKDLQISREVAELVKELKQPLYEKSWGSKPGFSIHSVYYREKTAEDEALEEKLRAEGQAKVAALTPQVNYSYHRDDVKALIRELEEELKRR